MDELPGPGSGLIIGKLPSWDIPPMERVPRWVICRGEPWTNPRSCSWLRGSWQRVPGWYSKRTPHNQRRNQSSVAYRRVGYKVDLSHRTVWSEVKSFEFDQVDLRSTWGHFSLKCGHILDAATSRSTLGSVECMHAGWVLGYVSKAGTLSFPWGIYWESIFSSLTRLARGLGTLKK